MDLYVFSGLGFRFEFGLQGVFFCYVSGLPFSLVLFCQQAIWDLEDFRAFICSLFSPALSNWFVHFVWNALGQRGSVGTGFGPIACVAFGGLQPPTA